MLSTNIIQGFQFGIGLFLSFLASVLVSLLLLTVIYWMGVGLGFWDRVESPNTKKKTQTKKEKED